jgi:hypothetical protein
MSRLWSWAGNAPEVELRREHARTLIGSKVARIRYFTLDYGRSLAGTPRIVQDAVEWQDPAWQRPGFDSLD